LLFAKAERRLAPVLLPRLLNKPNGGASAPVFGSLIGVRLAETGAECHGSFRHSFMSASSTVAKTTAKETSSHRVRIKIRAYDHKIIDQATRTIIETAERTGVKVVGPVPLPTEKKKWTVNRSTFVHKNAREQFEMRIHKRIVDILDPNAKTIDALTSLNLPAGVDVEIKM